MNDPETNWRKRSFDTVAELYDEYRPSYPEPLMEEILSMTGIPDDGHIL